MTRHSQVYLREEDISIHVPNSLGKPEIPIEIRRKWQRLIDLLSRSYQLPASLVMKMTETTMKVFLSSRSEGNPYSRDAEDTLGHGLYCETVIGRNESLEVPDAREISAWTDNPDIRLGMISYLGFPLRWPDGAVFGTICSLDSRKREYDDVFRDLIRTFKEIIELDLKRELELKAVSEDKRVLDHTLREIHHRIKNHFFMVSAYIQMQRMLRNESIDDLFNGIESRVKAIGLVHEKIYKSKNLNPDTAAYIDDLSRLVVTGITDAPIDIRLDVESVRLGKKLTNLGIVLVELITNSLKHGITKIPDPRISISIRCDEDAVRFVYSDNGIGFEGQTEDGLGTTILKGFARSVEGQINISGDDGFRAEILFTVRDDERFR